MVVSKEYRNLMSATLGRHNTYEPRSTALDCLARVWEPEPLPDDKDLFKLMHTYAYYLMEKAKDAFYPPQVIEPTSQLDPIEQMLQDQLLGLQPFASMSAETRSEVTVDIQIPAWFTASPYACSFRQAAEATFGRVVGL